MAKGVTRNLRQKKIDSGMVYCKIFKVLNL